MAKPDNPIPIYLEITERRTLAVALDWPGWARGGRDEASALQALVDYAPRYARILKSTRLGFKPPLAPSGLVVVERLAGNASTAYGVPGLPLPHDPDPVAPPELERWQTILRACWRAFDAAVQAADGHELRKGPRGGGRDLDKIVAHVRDANGGYLTSLGGSLTLSPDLKPDQVLAQIRQAILTTLEAAVRGETPKRGPRGGLRWSPRYFVRRLAWHDLDHLWEIEDRIITE